MKNEMLDENNKLIHTGNSGEVYYSGNNSNPGSSSPLGEIECKKCNAAKPFERVRWDDNAKLYICLDCMEGAGGNHHK